MSYDSMCSSYEKEITSLRATVERLQAELRAIPRDIPGIDVDASVMRTYEPRQVISIHWVPVNWPASAWRQCTCVQNDPSAPKVR
jgi:hypothetical protein